MSRTWWECWCYICGWWASWQCPSDLCTQQCAAPTNGLPSNLHPRLKNISDTDDATYATTATDCGYKCEWQI